MKKLFGGILPFFIFHLFCCGALLIFLTTSGYLLLISREGQRKTYLIPVLLISAIFLSLYHRHGARCRLKEYKTPADHLMGILLYVGFSFLLGLAFMIYVFIPWWIPNYTGGPLLP